MYRSFPIEPTSTAVNVNAVSANVGTLPATRAICIVFFYAAATLCLSSIHSHFNYTYMYILPQSARLTGGPAH